MPGGHDLEPTPGGTDEPRLPLHAFPSPTVIPPLKQPHLHSIIFLHGRGSSARIFAPPFLSTTVRGPRSNIFTLREALPHTQFVFPTAPRSRATIYRRSIINQWYDGSGDWEEAVLGHARETIEFVHALMREEASRVGNTDRVFLGGFSQGCAAALLCLLLWEGDALGGFLGMCGMLPMAGVIEDTLRDRHHAMDDEIEDTGRIEPDDNIFGSSSDGSPFGWNQDDSEANPLEEALRMLREEVGLPPHSFGSVPPFQNTPVFLGHGIRDDKVLLRHGQQACRTLQLMGCNVQFETYCELDHWYSKEMLQDLLEFLEGEGCHVHLGGRPGDYREGKKQELDSQVGYL
ncbi:Putative phospholipase/carboxylesterase/thioesterase, alpha/Beta hydrolase [Colletotrichum destructivum]|uniref:Phospholipase/carboxylesterase/thioesterase, alpha/Beta hydrolase n=1 Tax=Colletotrichum destructivum TaxID=34406 RepID=A0AAX4ISG6_9PEZI|nr:Putative phospholipase/carboxylesterase/thioesterase, alpha/Beta hydrolase [Colletotrichum destructivum]